MNQLDSEGQTLSRLTQKIKSCLLSDLHSRCTLLVEICGNTFGKIPLLWSDFWLLVAFDRPLSNALYNLLLDLVEALSDGVELVLCSPSSSMELKVPTSGILSDWVTVTGRPGIGDECPCMVFIFINLFLAGIKCQSKGRLAAEYGKDPWKQKA